MGGSAERTDNKGKYTELSSCVDNWQVLVDIRSARTEELFLVAVAHVSWLTA